MTKLLPNPCHQYFETVLDYFYTGELTIDQENVVSLFKIAHVLGIYDLGNKCLEWIKTNLNRQTAFTMLRNAILMRPLGDKQQIEAKCVCTIAKDFNLCSESDFCDHLVSTSLNQILLNNSSPLTHILEQAMSKANPDHVSHVVTAFIRSVDSVEGFQAEGNDAVKKKLFLELCQFVQEPHSLDSLFLLGKAIDYGADSLRESCLPVVANNFIYLNKNPGEVDDEGEEDEVDEEYSKMKQETDEDTAQIGKLDRICSEKDFCALVSMSLIQVVQNNSSSLPDILKLLLDAEVSSDHMSHAVTAFMRGVDNATGSRLESMGGETKSNSPLVQKKLFLELCPFVQVPHSLDSLFLLSKAIDLGADALRTSCLPVVAKNFIDLNHDDFAKIGDHTTVCGILDEDGLAANTEDQVFDAISTYCTLGNLNPQQQEEVWSTCRFAWLSDEYIKRLLKVENLPTRFVQVGLSGAALLRSDGNEFKTFCGEMESLEAKRLLRRTLIMTSSSIIDGIGWSKIAAWLNQDEQVNGYVVGPCTLLWRGTRDGFGANIFHSGCDNKTNTLTVIEATTGEIFGGFLGAAWINS